MDRFRNTRQPDRGWWRELRSAPERTLRDLAIGPGTVLADAGCGDGYFTLPAARFVDGVSVLVVDRYVGTMVAVVSVSVVGTLIDLCITWVQTGKFADVSIRDFGILVLAISVIVEECTDGSE